MKKFPKSLLSLVVIFLTLTQSASALTDNQPHQRILFVGNSYTEFHFKDKGKTVVLNDLPALVRAMITNPKTVVESRLNYGKPLMATITPDQTNKTLHLPIYEAVVLQEGHFKEKTSFADARDKFTAILKYFSSQSKTVLLLERIGINASRFDKSVYAAEAKVCRQTTNCQVLSPKKVAKPFSTDELLDPDGAHPRPILTWLNANLILAHLPQLQTVKTDKKITKMLQEWNSNQVQYGKVKDQNDLLSSSSLNEILQKIKPKN